MARLVTVQLGLDGMPGTTVIRFSASSLQTTRMAMYAIRAGEGHVFISAGVECVSRYVDPRAGGAVPDRFVEGRFRQAMARTRRLATTNAWWCDPRTAHLLPDVYMAMGQTAENVATLRPAAGNPV